MWPKQRHGQRHNRFPQVNVLCGRLNLSKLVLCPQSPTYCTRRNVGLARGPPRARTLRGTCPAGRRVSEKPRATTLHGTPEKKRSKNYTLKAKYTSRNVSMILSLMSRFGFRSRAGPGLGPGAAHAHVKDELPPQKLMDINRGPKGFLLCSLGSRASRPNASTSCLLPRCRLSGAIDGTHCHVCQTTLQRSVWHHSVIS